MKTYYIKAESEDALFDVLEQAGLTNRVYEPDDELNKRPEDADENWQPTGEYTRYPKDIELDCIGTIFKPTGVMIADDEGNMIPQMESLEGYHANMRGELTTEQEQQLPLIDKPASPYRVWAGE
jgi:hypothetical protein